MKYKDVLNKKGPINFLIDPTSTYEKHALDWAIQMYENNSIEVSFIYIQSKLL